MVCYFYDESKTLRNTAIYFSSFFWKTLCCSEINRNILLIRVLNSTLHKLYYKRGASDCPRSSDNTYTFWEWRLKTVYFEGQWAYCRHNYCLKRSSWCLASELETYNDKRQVKEESLRIYRYLAYKIREIWNQLGSTYFNPAALLLRVIRRTLKQIEILVLGFD